MSSLLHVSFFEDDRSSASISEALNAARNRGPVLRQGISIPDSFVANEKWFKFEVVKTDEKGMY